MSSVLSRRPIILVCPVLSGANFDGLVNGAPKILNDEVTFLLHN